MKGTPLAVSFSRAPGLAKPAQIAQSSGSSLLYRCTGILPDSCWTLARDDARFHNYIATCVHAAGVLFVRTRLNFALVSGSRAADSLAFAGKVSNSAASGNALAAPDQCTARYRNGMRFLIDRR